VTGIQKASRDDSSPALLTLAGLFRTRVQWAGVKDDRSRPFAGLIVGAAIVVLLALYVIGFFALGDDATAFIGARQFRVRVYP
jgi:hypothetical protein